MFTSTILWALLGLTPPCGHPVEVKRPAVVISGPVAKQPGFVIIRPRRPGR